MLIRFAGLFAIISFVYASQAAACFTIVVGKDASQNGYVIMAHNDN